MYITGMAVNRETTVRKLVSLPHALVQAIADFRFEQRVPTESEAIRRLIELGLEAAATTRPVKSLSKSR